ncbi:PepSY-associated TM helix domain-containing protein [Methylocystis sp. S23]
MIGLSGAILAYRETIDEQLNASIMRVERPQRDAAYRPIDEIVAAAAAAMPPDGKMERLTMPRQAGSAAAITYIVETDDLDTYVYEIFVDPYRAKVKGQRLFLHGDDPLSQPLVPILMTFHWTLLLGVNNAYVVGALGIVLFFSVLLGLYLWWPPNGNWRLGLKVKWGASSERVVYDLHKSLGVYCAVFLLITLFTGVAMIFKPATRSVANLFSPVRAEPDFGKSTPGSGRSPIGAGEAAAIANTIFPDGRLHWILFPNTPKAVYVVGKQSDGEPNQTKTYRNVGVDQYTGQVLSVQDRSRFSGGETFLEWLFPIHSGEAFGGLGRPIALLIGLSPLILYATGVTRWLQKRRTRRRSAF